MTNPLVHAIVLIAAIAIPGGLLVYFAWIACKGRENKIQNRRPTPKEARDAFNTMYPPQSLRAQSRKKQLLRARASRRKNSE
jgi:hypothetical protein